MAAAKYSPIIQKVFFDHFEMGSSQFEFERSEIAAAAEILEIGVPKNLGDVVYSFRYRQELPQTIQETCAEDEEWIIQGTGAARYRFMKVPRARIEPQVNL